MLLFLSYTATKFLTFLENWNTNFCYVVMFRVVNEMLHV